MEDINKDFWNRVDELRGRLSMREIAETAELPASSISSMRSKQTMPKLNAVYAMAKALNTTVEYLYAGEDVVDNYDAPLFRKLSSSQDLIDICEGLITATPEDIRLIQRVLGIRPSTLSARVDVIA